MKNGDKALKEFNKAINELKILMSSFNPDSKFAELVKQATVNAYRESGKENKMHMVVTLMWVIVCLQVVNLFLMFWLAQ